MAGRVRVGALGFSAAGPSLHLTEDATGGGARAVWLVPPGLTRCRWAPCPQVQEPRHQCTISDAWKGLRHVVQLRAREEFGHGSWSPWSPEASGTPWTGTVLGVAGKCPLCYCPPAGAVTASLQPPGFGREAGTSSRVGRTHRLWCCRQLEPSALLARVPFLAAEAWAGDGGAGACSAPASWGSH